MKAAPLQLWPVILDGCSALVEKTNRWAADKPRTLDPSPRPKRSLITPTVGARLDFSHGPKTSCLGCKLPSSSAPDFIAISGGWKYNSFPPHPSRRPPVRAATLCVRGNTRRKTFFFFFLFREGKETGRSTCPSVSCCTRLPGCGEASPSTAAPPTKNPPPLPLIVRK